MDPFSVGNIAKGKRQVEERPYLDEPFDPQKRNNEGSVECDNEGWFGDKIYRIDSEADFHDLSGAVFRDHMFTVKKKECGGDTAAANALMKEFNEIVHCYEMKGKLSNFGKDLPQLIKWFKEAGCGDELAKNFKRVQGSRVWKHDATSVWKNLLDARRARMELREQTAPDWDGSQARAFRLGMPLDGLTAELSSEEDDDDKDYVESEDGNEDGEDEGKPAAKGRKVKPRKSPRKKRGKNKGGKKKTSKRKGRGGGKEQPRKKLREKMNVPIPKDKLTQVFCAYCSDWYERKENFTCTLIAEVMFHESEDEQELSMLVVRFMPHCCKRGPSKGREEHRPANGRLCGCGWMKISFDPEEILGDTFAGLKAKLDTWSPGKPLPPGEEKRALNIEAGNTEQERTQVLVPNHLDFYKDVTPMKMMETEQRLLVKMVTHRGGETEFFPRLGKMKYPPDLECTGTARSMESVLHMGGFNEKSHDSQEEYDAEKKEKTKEKFLGQLSHKDGGSIEDPNDSSKLIGMRDNAKMSQCVWRNFSCECPISEDGADLMVFHGPHFSPEHLVLGQVLLWDADLVHAGMTYRVKKLYPRIISEILNSHHDHRGSVHGITLTRDEMTNSNWPHMAGIISYEDFKRLGSHLIRLLERMCMSSSSVLGESLPQEHDKRMKYLFRRLTSLLRMVKGQGDLTLLLNNESSSSDEESEEEKAGEMEEGGGEGRVPGVSDTQNALG